MTSVADDTLVNSSFIEAARCYIYECFGALTQLLGLASNITVQDTISTNFLLECYNSVGNWLAFDEFQFKLLKGFILILFANIVFIFISWKVYGKKISERFMKPPTSKAIEELRKSVSLLKLPKEHSPRV